MKRFFFDLYSDTVTRDEKGIVLENVETARAHAIKCAQMMAADDASKGQSDLTQLLKVTGLDTFSLGKRLDRIRNCLWKWWCRLGASNT